MPSVNPLTDQSTQLYEAVLTTLYSFAPLASAYRTNQDLSASSFQQLMENYQAGDTPALLLKPISDVRDFFNLNSKAFAWTQEIGVAITTDDQQITNINNAAWLIPAAIAAGPKNFGITSESNGFCIKKWDLVGGKMDLKPFQSQLDDAANGAARWRAAALFRIQCVMSWVQLTAMATAQINL